MNAAITVLAPISPSRSAPATLALACHELQAFAQRQLATEVPGPTLQGAALGHEARLRVSAGQPPLWAGRSHFATAASEAKRRILADPARREQAGRPGARRRRTRPQAARFAAPGPDTDLLALNEARERLSAPNPLKAELVNRPYLTG
ncbi:MAG TPA: ECF-type sigma factor [Methylomirabilota bacterium]|nr:ECF-type sigma factor [Methylomirabilota bacterium]